MNSRLSGMCTLLIVGICSFPLIGQQLDWMFGARVSHAGNFNAIATDKSGSIYCAADFYSKAWFNPADTTIKNEAYTCMPDACLLKYSSSGKFQWLNRHGFTEDDRFSAITIDESDNIFVAGQYGIGKDKTTDAHIDFFVARFDTAGKMLWKETWDTNRYVYPADIAVDNNGTVYASARLTNSFILTTYDYDGTMLWLKAVGSAHSYAMTLDDDGNIYLTGELNGEADFDTDTGTYRLKNVDADLFIAKYTREGSLIWAKKFGDAGGEIGVDLKVDGDGNLIVSGCFQDSIDLDPASENGRLAARGTQGFIAKFTPDGDFVWAVNPGRLNQGGFACNCHIDIDDDGNVYSGTYDTLIMKYDNDGNLEWAYNEGILLNDIHVDDNILYLSGCANETTDLDPGPGTAYSGTRMTLARYLLDSIPGSVQTPPQRCVRNHRLRIVKRGKTLLLRLPTQLHAAKIRISLYTPGGRKLFGSLITAATPEVELPYSLFGASGHSTIIVAVNAVDRDYAQATVCTLVR